MSGSRMNGGGGNGNGNGDGYGSSRRGRFGSKSPAKKPEVLKTWVFDSVGDRKYALQVRKARNGNPCLRLVEGVPQEDGTYRKFHLDVWSEDFPALFRTLDEVRAYIEENDIRTPAGHKWKPRSQRPARSSRPAAASGRPSP